MNRVSTSELELEAEVVEEAGAFSRSWVILGCLPYRWFEDQVNLEHHWRQSGFTGLLSLPSQLYPASQSIAMILPSFNKSPG
jgi:hypothetical protein